VVSARGALDSGCEASEFFLVFKNGTPVSPERSRQRERERRAAEASSAQAAAEAKARIDRERKALGQCHELFKQTSNKKVSYLTVVESQAVKACESRGYYEEN
jgi:hypothetical protein